MEAKIKILVISNDSAMQRFLKQNLNESDYQVADTQYTGEKLKATLDEEYPDIAILDIMMPSLDGLKICLRIRQWSQVPIIMLSAWGAGGDKVRGLNLSADGYLTDPFGIEELIARIDIALQQNVAVMNLLSGVISEAPVVFQEWDTLHAN